MQVHNLRQPTSANIYQASITLGRGGAVPVNKAEFKAEVAGDAHFVAQPSWGVKAKFINPAKSLLDRIMEMNRKRLPADFLNTPMKSLKMRMHTKKLRPFDGTEFRALVRRYTKGAAEADLALLQGIVDLKDPEFAALGFDESALMSFTEEHSQTLLAALHIDEIAQKFADVEVDYHDLKALYEHVIITTTSVLSALARMMNEKGDISADRLFLQNACARDLAALDMGADKAHLEVVLQELKGMKILALIRDTLGVIVEKRLNGKSEGVLSTTLQYVEQPISTFPNIEKWVQASTIPEQILFFQDYRNLFQRIPEEAYLSGEQKNQCKNHLQQRIDPLVYSEES